MLLWSSGRNSVSSWLWLGLSHSPSIHASLFGLRLFWFWSPRRVAIAFVNAVFPAPVSPVMTMRPFWKLTVVSSNSSRFLMVRLCSTLL